MDHAIISKGVPRPLPGFIRSPDLLSKTSSLRSGFRMVSCRRSKGTGLQSPALSLLKSLPGFFSLRFSHRFQRIAKAPLVMYSASPNDWGVFAFIYYFLKHAAATHDGFCRNRTFAQPMVDCVSLRLLTRRFF